MVVTQGGIYHNLKESRYVITCENGLVTYFFSSKMYMHKFLNTYKENREKNNIKMSKLLKDFTSDIDLLSDICYYKQVEKRGFLVLYKGDEMTWQESQTLGLQRRNEKKSLNYQEVSRLKLRDYLRIMDKTLPDI
ncbi:late transcriptional activator [Bacillus phage GA1]|uniref:Protein p4G n=1 Tax=Bacillus phage GA-1 TaxID=2679898 RepID=Q9T1J9_BPGA1|nr:late transcriptional activator [Bacillus phage GA1]CAC21525.1 protein p4G [Bacillus phage GA1]